MDKKTPAPATPAPPVDLAEQSRVRREKLDKLRADGRAYPHNVKVSNTAGELLKTFGEEQDAAKLEEAGPFSIAGRVTFIRAFGKAGFVKVRDRSETLQLYVAKDALSEANFEDYKSLDFGDIVLAEGKLFRTKTGELSLKATRFETLVKCLHAPPEKFHGLSDVEERYRKRYVDLLSNDEARKTFLLRSRIVSGIRKYFLDKDFLEVETPILHSLVTGAAARPFKTHHNALDMGLVMRIAPELHLKRLVVGGLERVFEMNRNFRNEGISIRHNPEFTMLEFYMAYATYHDLMDLTEELISGLCQEIHGTTDIEWMGQKISLGRPWKRITMEDAVKEYSTFKGKMGDTKAMREHLTKLGVAMNGREGAGTLLNLMYEAEAEKNFVQPTFVTGHPVEISPLARRDANVPESGIERAERFEFFINGMELGNGFNELNDPDDQKERFQAQLKEKDAGNHEANDFDADYIQALEYGMPPTAGEGIGIDRLVMLLTNSSSIRDVILFPHMRSK